MCPKVAPEYLAQRRREILDAALVCFSSVGYDRTSIGDVARACGMSVGSIYKYFPSKASLFQAIALEQYGILEQELRARTESAETAAEALYAAVEHFLGRVAVEGEVWGPIYFEFRVQSRTQPRLAKPLRDLGVRQQARLVGLIERGLADGTIRAGLDPTGTAALIRALLEGYALEIATRQSTRAPGDVLAALFSLLRPCDSS